MKKLIILAPALLTGFLLVSAAPLDAQKVSELDAAVRAVTDALMAGKPMSSAAPYILQEKDLDELLGIMRAAPPPVLRFCRNVRDPARKARNRGQMKRSIARIKKQWDGIREQSAKAGIKMSYTRIREFRVESDCGVRFYRVNLEGRLERDGVNGKLKLRGMRMIYYAGRFKVVRLFRFRIAPPKRLPKPKKAPPPKGGDISRGIIG